MEETHLEPIVDILLNAMKLTSSDETVSHEELKSLIFANSLRTILSDSIQATTMDSTSLAVGGQYDWQQTWVCSATTVPTLHHRHVGIARLKHPTNLGVNAEEVQFFILVLCPSEIKQTKSALETGRTFATLFSDVGLRHELLEAKTAQEFKDVIKRTSNLFAQHQRRNSILDRDVSGKDSPFKWYHVGKGIAQDLRGRIPYYLDDFKDGVVGKNTIQKTISTTFFLYFSVILPAVALGVLNSLNTDGQISVEHVIVGHALGAIVFSFTAGQPLVVVRTTVPLAIFTKIIFSVSKDFGTDFLAFFALVGAWNTFFLTIYSFFNMSVLMKYSSRSTEEVFSNFISIAFIVDTTKSVVKTFKKHYYMDDCFANTDDPSQERSLRPLNVNMSSEESLLPSGVPSESDCMPDVAFLSLILMFGTVWLGVTLFEFNKRPFLNKNKRELLSEYALPVSVVVFCIIGRVLFSQVKLEVFSLGGDDSSIFRLADFSSVTWGSILGSGILGFSLSLLFFMDQNISAAMVNSPDNKLLKGTAYHWDLLGIGIINLFLSLFGFPFLHAGLPHSPLHVKCLADTEERVENGYVHSIVVRVRETRLTNIFSNILIGLTMLFLNEVLNFMPTAVLDGLFLYLALTALSGNQMFERIMLFFTEQSSYPPNHYIRRVPQRKVHIFTLCQLVQLAVLCVFGFYPWPYIKMIFPVIILVFLPVRHKLIPLLVEKKYLDVLDGH